MTTLSSRIYRLLLFAYPRPVREANGQDLEETFADRYEAVARERGFVGLAGLWTRTFWDVAINAILEWTRSLQESRTGQDGPHNRRQPNMSDTFAQRFVNRLSSVGKDLRFGIRMLVKHPGMSAIVIVTFGLGIGLTTVAFSIVNGAMIKGLPFDGGNRVAHVYRTNLDENIDQMGVSVHDYLDWRAQQTAFTDLAGYTVRAVNLADPDQRPERLTGAAVTANLFPVLGVQPKIGRGFLPEDEGTGAERVMILGHDVWQDRYGGSEDILGKTVRANGMPYTVVGVMPEDFAFPMNESVWIPLTIDPAASTRGSGPTFAGVGRLRDGFSFDEAGAQMATIAARIEQEYPSINEGVGARVEPFTQDAVGQAATILYTMLGAVFGVLLIACANVANLLLARASVRTREVAVRTALGASRGRVVMQLLSEVFVLSVAGGAFGLLLGYGGVAWFSESVRQTGAPFWMDFSVDRNVLLFVTALSVGAAAFAGLFPAIQASGTDVNSALKDEGRGSSSLKMGRFSSALIVGEAALSCALLIVAGLMIKSVVQLNTVDLPFATEGILTARINLPVAEYPDTAARVGLYERLLPAVRAIPGVEAATLSDGLPASGNGSRVFQVEGVSYERDLDYPSGREGIVTPGYFDTFDAEVLQGRAFTDFDIAGALPVAVVNETFARTFFDGEAIGRRVRMGQSDSTAAWLTVVGIVPDMRMEGIGNGQESPAGFYIPIAQSGVGGFVSIAIQSVGDPATLTRALRDAVISIDANLPIYDVQSMDAMIVQQTWFYRTFGALFTAFGLAALFLASVGLYGVMSFAVNRRRQEFGVRLALGAQAGRLIGFVMKKGIIQLSVGTVVGIALGVLAANPLQLILFEVSGRDPFVFGTVVSTLLVTGLLATFIPARRVTKVDPARVLSSQ